MNDLAYTPDLFADSPPAPVAQGAVKRRSLVPTGTDSFFNTTRITGDELATYRRQAVTQETVIAEFFRQRPGRLFTPSDLSSLLPRAPLTSIRRAVSNLTAQGLLEKTAHKRPGTFNRPEHAWRLKEGNHVTSVS